MGLAEQVSLCEADAAQPKGRSEHPGSQVTSASSTIHLGGDLSHCEWLLPGLCAAEGTAILAMALFPAALVPFGRSLLQDHLACSRSWTRETGTAVPCQSMKGRSACGVPPVLPSLCISFREEHFWSSLAATQHNCFAHQ